MEAIAMTDHGVMYGVIDFYQEARKQGIKPIIGCEVYLAPGSRLEREEVNGVKYYHLILLAENQQGYRNLVQLVSLAHIEGFYYKPRVDKELLRKYHEGLICLSACVMGEIPQAIIKGNQGKAEALVREYIDIFGKDNFFLEIQNHQLPEERIMDRGLIELAHKYGIGLVATNDLHYVRREDSEFHDILLCVQMQKTFDDPTRMRFNNDDYYMKSPEEMAALFPDCPEALENTMEVADKVETYSVDSDPLMPVFPIPESFGTEQEWRSKFTDEQLFDEFTQNERHEVIMNREAAEKKILHLGGYNKLHRIKFEADYLEHLVWEGARKRYLPDSADVSDLSDEIKERIRFELHTIKTMGFPGYFLIVSDYIRAAREELGVSVGPGRGSAAGSVVAYCLRITDLDPMKYDLLFERFLNPDRISLPDIDVDFDDAGRDRVLDWVTEKYGKERVAHIITYGTMAAKSSIADVGRVEKVPLDTVNSLKKLIPDRGFPENVKDEKGNPPKVNLHNCYKYVPELRRIMEGDDMKIKQMLTYAEELEDTNRQIGIHACGVIIGSQDITNVAPVCIINDKESGKDVLVTQYDGHVVENVGLIKMDFLGLKNLTIIKNCVAMVKKCRGEMVDIDHLPMNDEPTYKLFCDGNTVGVFQFESAGMQKYLRELQPHVIDDLIAMNALYRPGPMDNIPEFIDRKQGRKPIAYDLPVMEQYLKETYGITVYQEQVMLLSRLLAGFTRGQSDTLRKAMGKKQIDKMNELEVLFYEGGEKNGHPKETLNKIWEEWKKFASYAFNKSHAACYSWVAYQTAYLKAHYPAEYMAAVMTSAQTDIGRVRELMDDCRRNGIEVAAPNVNHSDMDFNVDSDGRIRFGLQAISGMGEAASNAIIAEREKEGPFKDIFDFLKRIDMHTVNKKNMEVLVKAGAFDGVGPMHRAQYFYKENSLDTTPTFLDRLVSWAIRRQDSASSAQMSIFDMSSELAEEEHPPVPSVEPWNSIVQCKYEKEVISTYLSGHPLDDYRYEMQYYVSTRAAELVNLENMNGREVRLAGLVSDTHEGTNSKGEPFGSMTINDYSGSYTLRLKGDEYSDFRGFFKNDTFVYLKGTVVARPYTDKSGVNKVFTKIRIGAMMNLGSVMDRYTSRLNFKVALSDIDETFCKTIEKLAKKHKGKIPLQATVLDITHNLSLTLGDDNLKVSARDIIPELEKVKGIYEIKPHVKS